MKKILAILLSALLLCGCFSLPAAAETVSGSCGTGLAWALDTERGILTVSGTGDMKNFSSGSPAPWKPYVGGIRTAILEPGVTSIGSSAFSGCVNLTDIAIPDGVTKLGDSSFGGCTSLAAIVLPYSVKMIGGFAFSGCSTLTSFTFPPQSYLLGNCAFQNCTALTAVYFPAGMTDLPNETFKGCTSLASVTIPDTVRAINGSVFNGCSSLRSIRIPDGVTYVNTSAFYECAALTCVAFPDSVRGVATSAFYGCNALTAVYCDAAKDTISFSKFNTALTDAAWLPRNTCTHTDTAWITTCKPSFTAAGERKLICTSCGAVCGTQSVFKLIRGDVNTDGAVNGTDLAALRQKLLGVSVLNEEQFRASELNGDGRVNLIDLIRLKKQSAK